MFARLLVAANIASLEQLVLESMCWPVQSLDTVEP